MGFQNDTNLRAAPFFIHLHPGLRVTSSLKEAARIASRAMSDSRLVGSRRIDFDFFLPKLLVELFFQAAAESFNDERGNEREFLYPKNRVKS